MKNKWNSKSKCRNIVKKASENSMFFNCAFLLILGRFGAGFGRVLGGGWKLLDTSWAAFWRHFLYLVFGMLFGRILGASQAGFWDISGRVWAGFWGGWEVFGGHAAPWSA